MQLSLNFELQAKQSLAFHSLADEIFYAGAVGGGKSHLMRVVAILYCLAIDNCQVYLFRRTYPELVQNHVDNENGFRDMLKQFEALRLCTINEHEIKFKNGSIIRLCHCQHEKDRFKYQGAQIDVLLIDELTSFTESIYTYLRHRLRTTKDTSALATHFQKIPFSLCSGNPGGVGHQFVKNRFIQNIKPYEIHNYTKYGARTKRQFIPAYLHDNTALLAADPHYAGRVMEMGEKRGKALLLGDWNLLEGAFFECFSEKRHVVTPHVIPSHWQRFRSFDWGSYRPFCVLWFAVAAEKYMHYNRGDIVVYREWYGASKNEINKGLGLTIDEIGQGIIMREAPNEKIETSPADSILFQKNGHGISMSEDLHKMGLNFKRAKLLTSRIEGWQQVLLRLNTDKIKFFNHCYNLIRTMPQMLHDEHRVEDIDTDLEDHAMDALRYGCCERIITSSKSKEETSKLEYNTSESIADYMNKYNELHATTR